MDRGSNLVCTVACSHISPCDWQGHTMQTSSFGGERSFMAKTVPDLRDVGAPAFLILNQERASSNLETRPPHKKNKYCRCIRNKSFRQVKYTANIKNFVF